MLDDLQARQIRDGERLARIEEMVQRAIAGDTGIPATELIQSLSGTPPTPSARDAVIEAAAAYFAEDHNRRIVQNLKEQLTVQDAVR